MRWKLAKGDRGKFVAGSRTDRHLRHLVSAPEELEPRILLSSPAVLPPLTAATQPPTAAKVPAGYLQSPLWFTPTVGQAGAPSAFSAGGLGYSLALTNQGAFLSLGYPSIPGSSNEARTGADISAIFVGASPTATLVGSGQLPGTANFFIGSDPSKYRTDVPTYASVVDRGVYPGIDMVYYGNQRHLEYDFHVHPGADPSQIEIQFSGAHALHLDRSGNLVITTAGGDVVESAPVVYQDLNGSHSPIAARYVLHPGGRVGFAISGPYNPKAELVIDPVVQFGTFFGGTLFEVEALPFGFIPWKEPEAIAVDPNSGNVYIASTTESTGLATPGVVGPNLKGSWDVFVAEFSPDCSKLIFCTYIGGSGVDEAYGIGLEPGKAGGAPSIYVAGTTFSKDFPVAQPKLVGNSAGFVLKLTPLGKGITWCDLLGGANQESSDSLYALAVNPLTGVSYVTGAANDWFPITPGAYASPRADALNSYGIIGGPLIPSRARPYHSPRTDPGHGGEVWRLQVSRSKRISAN
jgi:hypothetical protein